MALPKLIGLAGPSGSGKTTLAEAIEDHWPHSRMSFSDPIKDMLCVMGLDDDEVYGDKKDKPSEFLGGHTPRYAMITLAEDWGHQRINTNLWVNIWKRHARDAARYGWSRVVDDVRKVSQLEAIKSFGGVVVWVGRPGNTNTDCDVTPDMCDYSITNEGDITQVVDNLGVVLTR